MPFPLKDSAELLVLARKNWHSPLALMLAELVVLAVWCVVALTLRINTALSALGLGLPAVALVLFWALSNRTRRTKRGRVGFVVCLSVGDEAERKRVGEDFIRPLRELMAAGAARSRIQAITIEEHRACKVVGAEDARRELCKRRAHFMLYGRVRPRPVEGKTVHIIDLHGLVVHRPLQAADGALFAREFAELLPGRISFSEENDVFSFEFTSVLVDVVSRYLIAKAAALSGDFGYAETLCRDIRLPATSSGLSVPLFAKLASHIPMLLAAVNLTRARKSYDNWVRTRDPRDLQAMSSYLDKIDPRNQHSSPVAVLRAIEYFVLERDIERAKGSLSRWCRDSRDGTWLFNLAFLCAYQGDLARASRYYRRALELPRSDDVIAQVEQFCEWVMEMESDKYQLHFCLGFLNRYAKGDTSLAIRHFEDFLQACPAQAFRRERSLAVKWLGELRSGETPAGA